MSTEELKQEVQEGQVEEAAVEQATTTETPQVSPKEEKALAQGWKPKDEWVASGGDPTEWRDAQAFLDRGEFLHHISAQNKQIKELLNAQRALTEHNRKLAETRYKEELASLKIQKKAAIEAQDAEAIVELDDQILEVKDKAAEVAASAVREQAKTAEIQTLPPEFQQWVERNSWYAQNPKLRDYADVVGARYAKEHPGVHPTEVLAYVERDVRDTFKPQFANKNREAPSAVEGGSGNRRVAAAKSEDDVTLTDEEARVMKTLVAQNVMTEAEYKKQIKALGARR